MSWTDEHGVTHDARGYSVLFVRCMTPVAKPGTHGATRWDDPPRPVTCLTCLVFDLDAVMLGVFKEMRARGITVDQQVLANLERKCNVH